MNPAYIFKGIKYTLLSLLGAVVTINLWDNLISTKIHFTCQYEGYPKTMEFDYQESIGFYLISLFYDITESDYQDHDNYVRETMLTRFRGTGWGESGYLRQIFNKKTGDMFWYSIDTTGVKEGKHAKCTQS